MLHLWPQRPQETLGQAPPPPECLQLELRSEHQHLLSLTWGHPVMWSCCGLPRRTLHSEGYAAFECRGHRVRLDGCVPRLLKRRPQVGASYVSKPTISSQSLLLVHKSFF